MSNNSFENRRAARELRAFEAAEYGFEFGNLKKVAARARADLAFEARSAERVGMRFVSVEGIAALVREATNIFEFKVSGSSLPWNLDGRTSTGYLWELDSRVGRWLPREEADALIERTARFAGWLKAAAELPHLRRMIRATQSGRGVGSARTTIDLWGVVKKFPAPDSLNGQLRHVQWRADMIIRAYRDDLRVSWQSVMKALMQTTRVGRAAVIAVATSLGLRTEYNDERVTYRQARQWLIEHRLARTTGETVEVGDGGIAHLVTGEPEYRAGWKVETALRVDRYGRRELVDLARCGEVVRCMDLGRAFQSLSNYYVQFNSWGQLGREFRGLVDIVQQEAGRLIAGWRHAPRVTTEKAFNAFLGNWHVVEAAHKAALAALGLQAHERGLELPKLQECLRALSDEANPVADNSDGVQAHLHPEPVHTDGDLTVTRGVSVAHDGRRSTVWLVRENGRTYHARPWMGADNPAFEAAAQARAAWLRQDEAQTEEADLAGFLRGESGFWPLIVRRDSASAGNCKPGTEAWLRERGWADRSWIPGVWLIPHLGDSRVRRVVAALKLRLRR